MWIASASCPAFWDSPPSRYTTRTVLRPVQAHVQAGVGACLAGSRLDKVTDLVDQPEAVTARHLLRGGAVPGERISDVPGVSYLADELLAGSPNLHRSAATGVAQGIAGELADGDHQVGNAWQREPGPLGLGGDKAANLAQVVAVTQRLGVRWRGGEGPHQTGGRPTGRSQRGGTSAGPRYVALAVSCQSRMTAGWVLAASAMTDFASAVR